MDHDRGRPRPAARRALPFRLAQLPPWLPPVLALAWIAIAAVALWVVDARGALGGPERLLELGLDPPYVWFQLFMDGGVTEILQWLSLGVLIVFSAGLAVAHRQRAAAATLRDDHERLAAFWTLIAVMAVLMLLEDAGNVRHLLTHYVGVAVGFEPRPVTVAEIVYFAAIASVGGYAVVRYVRDLGRRASLHRTSRPGAAASDAGTARRRVTFRFYGILGVLVYGSGAAINASRTIGDWYIGFGRWLVDDVLQAPQLVRAVPVDGLDEWDLRFMFVDFVIEESLELLGATLLVAAVLAYLRHDPELRVTSWGRTARRGASGEVDATAPMGRR
jgi:hypothetical protein